MLHLLLVQLLISSVLPRTRMRGNSMARLSSSWNRGNWLTFSYLLTVSLILSSFAISFWDGVACAFMECVEKFLGNYIKCLKPHTSAQKQHFVQNKCL